MQETSVTKRFNELFDKLEHCDEDEQKQKIEEMNEMINEMNKEEFKTVFTKEMFDKVDEMIEEKKLPLENAILLLKRIGYCNVMKHFSSYSFDKSLLGKWLREIIFEELKKKEEKNEMLFVDLCECYLLLSLGNSQDLRLICILCLLKEASKKEENEEVQKDVEMALFALSCIGKYYIFDGELHLNEIKEIIEYHQEHRNLSQLAYQSAWAFLINLTYFDRSFGSVIVNELHFMKEETKALEEIRNDMVWKKNEKEKEMKKGIVLERCLDALNAFGRLGLIRNKEFIKLTTLLMGLCRTTRGNYRYACEKCFLIYVKIILRKAESSDCLPSVEAVGFVLEEMCQPTINSEEIVKEESEKAKQKMMLYRKLREKMEEEGYEDIIVSFKNAVLEPNLTQRITGREFGFDKSLSKNEIKSHNNIVNARVFMKFS
eukprot:MONOS_15665.1-p1 / transcript=MONOS_15665.1 / gene=MONOS_15665 / organism=Monocercomonoides_exilis_PA203 / gene_product=unspecified product / transcript_product=unspecified product / location=Mono_scaffold01302:9751-11338(+) / protein_length=431 / sequence_SO=supercontig / SO=protein_coding / is_pseudo=false